MKLTISLTVRNILQELLELINFFSSCDSVITVKAEFLSLLKIILLCYFVVILD